MCGRYAVFGPASVPQDALPILREMDRHHRKNAPPKADAREGLKRVDVCPSQLVVPSARLQAHLTDVWCRSQELAPP